MRLPMSAKGIRENRLLQLLTAASTAELGPVVSVQLTARELIQEPGTPTLYAYFPVTAVVSLVTTMESGASTELALVGHEGLIGLSAVLGTAGSLTSAVVQIPGIAVRLPMATLKAARAANSSVRKALDLYTEARLIQVAQTAACNRLHPVDARLARWLLAIHDRIDGDEFAVSQEFIAEMLGVHRPTVSTAFQRLQEQHAILRRGRAIVIADRGALERFACECHRVVEREFDRLFRPALNATDVLAVSAAPRSSEREPHGTAALEALREIAGRLLLANIREHEAREQAEAANRTKDQFLAMVSHELRAPLNVILGWCAILTSGDDHAPKRGLEIIERNARAQLKLVEDLLDAARMQSATLSIQPGRVNLSELVPSVVDAMRPAAEEKGVALRASMAGQIPPIRGDADRLRQVLLNVLTNALKFTDRGGSVEVGVTSAAGRARVIIRDTGRGIAPDVLPHIFEQFRQGSAPGSAPGGLGLGLTITRALVELHRGTIEIESPGQDHGTTCTIDFPLEDHPTATPAAVRKM
jgi:signal transduction histidine kinase